MVGGLLDTQRALEFAERGMLKPIYERYSIDRLPAALEWLWRVVCAGRCVVDFNA
jgi:propanol-preferring alcohol dehydrogenase